MYSSNCLCEDYVECVTLETDNGLRSGVKCQYSKDLFSKVYYKIYYKANRY